MIIIVIVNMTIVIILLQHSDTWDHLPTLIESEINYAYYIKLLLISERRTPLTTHTHSGSDESRHV